MPKGVGYPNDKPKLGLLGKGKAREAGEKLSKNKKRKKRKLDSIMGSIRSGRGK